MRPLTEFLTDLRKRNIRLWLEDGVDLGFSAPPGALAGPILAELKARKGEVVAFFQQAAGTKTGGVIEAGIGDGRLSYAQERLWFLDQLEPGNPFYNVALALRLKGELNVGALRKGIDTIVARHGVLRTTFPAVDGEARVVVAEVAAVPLPIVDLSGLEEEEREGELYRLAKEEGLRPFDLAEDALLRVTLLKLGEADHALFLTMHHIVSDGWSLGVLVQEIGAVYVGAVSAEVMGRPVQLAELPIQYDDFAVWQRGEAYQARLKEQLDYWKGQLAAIPPELTLPTDRPRPPEQSFRGSSVRFVVDAAVTAKLRALSQQEGATLFMTLAAGLSALLYRYSHQEDILIGTPIANRTVPELEGLVGFFVNTLVLRADVSAERPFRALLKQMRKRSLEAFANQDLPFEMLVDTLQPERDLSRNPIFQVMFALQNAPLEDLALPGLQISAVETERTAALFDLVLDMWETGETLTGVWEFNSDLFDRETIERMIGHFKMLLGVVGENAEIEVGEIGLMGEEEIGRLGEIIAGPVRDYPLGETIHGLFEAQVEKTPEKVAVWHRGESLTYGELNGRANQIAYCLRETGLQNNDFVAILDERGVDFLTAILGIHKAGGAYLPIDPTYPDERVQYMLSNSQVARLISRGEFLEKVDWEKTAVEHVLDLAAGGWRLAAGEVLPSSFILHPSSLIFGYPSENLVHTTTGRDRAYMLYTSGSTGLPKGAIIRHDGAVNHMYGEFELLGFDGDVAFLQSAPSSSDISVWQFWGPVLCGGRSVIVDLDVVADPARLFEVIRDEGITIFELVPVVLKGLVDFAMRLGAAERALPDLRWAMVTGEAVQAALVNEWLGVYPEIPVINAYGPTEAADDVTQFVIREPLPLDGRPVPVGRPLPNVQILVVDERLRPVPVGVTGEICVGGVGVGEGYWNNPEKTGESFVAAGGWRLAAGKNVWPIASGQQPTAIYRTGDRGRWLADGVLEYIERMDQQVKVRGFRIELGEIEGVLDQHGGVEKSVVAVRPDGFGEKQLVGYVVATAEARESAALVQEQVTLWQDLHEQSYSETLLLDDDPFLNVIGWDSNYTNEPLPAEQLREYIGFTVERALATRPSKVLEIGCGTGMIAFQLLPEVDEYWGTDISEVAVAGLKRVQADEGLQARSPKLKDAVFEARAADDFSGWEKGQFDLALLPSVVQYFPSVEYLREVLIGLVGVLADGGAIYVGDVRSLPLLEAFHASVQLHKADAGVTAATLKQRIWQQLQQEQEMAIDPAFFVALAETVPEIGRVEILPKRGRGMNEMTRFRYDVVLRVEKEIEIEGRRDEGRGMRDEGVEWGVEKFGIGKIREMLERGEAVALRGVGNARVAGVMALLGWLGSAGGGEVVGEFRAQGGGVEPEDLWGLGVELGFEVEIGVTLGRGDGAFDVRFWRGGEGNTEAQRHGEGVADGEGFGLPMGGDGVGEDLGFQRKGAKAQRREEGREGVEGGGTVRRPATAGEGPAASGQSPAASTQSKIQNPQSKIHWWLFANNPLREKVARGLVPAWREFLKGRLPGHMVPNQFVLLDGLPLTPNGKVDREALPTPDPARRVSSSGYVAPTTDVEAAVCQIWQDVLGLSQVGVLDNFFELGGHSLKATQVISRIQRDLGVELPLRELFNYPTVGELAGQIAQHDSGELVEIPRQPDAADYPVSHAQHRLWVLAQMGEGLAAYNMPAAIEWAGLLDVGALQVALDGIVARHEALRTTFVVVDGGPRQKVHGEMAVPIRVVDLRGVADADEKAQGLAAEDAAAPFDLGAGPLIRLTVVRLGVDRHVLLLNLHHIVSDAWSEGVFMREFVRLYEAARTSKAIALPELKIQYRDYAVWQRGYLAGEEAQADEAFWRGQLAGELPVLDFPADFARPPVKTYSGRAHRVGLTVAQTAALQKLSRENGVTLFMTLTALVQTLLYRYTGQDDILLGTPVHGRFHPDLEGQVGFYINTVVLRQEIGGDRPFVAFLADVKETATAAFDHQDYPFDRLVQALNLQRDVSRNPVFDAAIVYQSVEPNEVTLPEVEIRPFVTGYEGSKFDLSFTFEPADDGLRLDIVYNTDLYRPERMVRLGGHFAELVNSVLVNSGESLDGLGILPEGEWEVIDGFHGEEERRGAERQSDRGGETLVGWFEAQVERGTDRVAVVFEGEEVTYGELNGRANVLAHRLIDAGGGG